MTRRLTFAQAAILFPLVGVSATGLPGAMTMIRAVGPYLVLLVTLAFCARLTWAQREERNAGAVSGSAHQTIWTTFGWPNDYLERSQTSAMWTFELEEQDDEWSIQDLMLDALVVVLLAASVACCGFLLVGFVADGFQFSVASLLGLVTSIGCAFAARDLLRIPANPFYVAGFGGEVSLYGWGDLSLFGCAFFGAICAASTVISLAGRAVRRFAQVLWPGSTRSLSAAAVIKVTKGGQAAHGTSRKLT